MIEKLQKKFIKGCDIIFYIKECNEDNKILLFIKKFFKIITIKDNVIVIPINENSINKKTLLKISNKLNKILRLRNIKTVAISEFLFKNKLFKNQIYKENIHILDGKWLFNYLCVDSIDYIINTNNTKIENVEISILSNSIDEVLENNILNLAQRCKLLNIITNNIEKFNNISEYLHNTHGIMIRVSRNKKKGLLKSGIVINYDFTDELVNKCKLNNKAVLINLNNKVNISSKAFTGININFYGIEFKKFINETFKYLDLDKCFSKEILYESLIYQKGNYNTIRTLLKNDEVKIKNLIGINGKINPKEYIIYQNILTKT